MAVAFRAQSAAWVGGATQPMAPAIPTGTTTGDIMLLFGFCKPFDSTVPTISGWTLVDSGASGSTANGNGVGSVLAACWSREWQSGDGAPSFTFTGGNTWSSLVVSYSKTLTYWAALGKGKGGHETSNAVGDFTYTGLAAGDVASGDMLQVGSGVCDDTATLASGSAAATDATVGALTGASSGANTQGLDICGSTCRFSITAGSNTATPTSSLTFATAETGKMSIMVRLRDTDTAPPAYVSQSQVRIKRLPKVAIQSRSRW